jgi:hypothetical protein
MRSIEDKVRVAQSALNLAIGLLRG